MRKNAKVLLAAATLIPFVPPAEASAIRSINFPDAVATEPRGINNSGQVVGTYIDTGGRAHGFFLDRIGGILTTVDVPGGGNTFLFGISNRGEMVGTFGEGLSTTTHGFFLSSPGGTPVIFDVPGAFATQAYGINSSGQIVGGFASGPSGNTVHGFLLDGIGGSFTTIDIPGAVNYTSANAINDNGQIVGGFGELNLMATGDTLVSSTGFRLDTIGGTPVPINAVPGSPVTVAMGINNTGDISGFYCVTARECPGSGGSGIHGFVLLAGTASLTFDVPGASSTALTGINDRRIVLGSFGVGPVTSTHGFAAEIPEPSTLTLITFGTIGLCLGFRFRRLCLPHRTVADG